jgi:hypothetical protein
VSRWLVSTHGPDVLWAEPWGVRRQEGVKGMCQVDDDGAEAPRLVVYGWHGHGWRLCSAGGGGGPPSASLSLMRRVVLDLTGSPGVAELPFRRVVVGPSACIGLTELPVLTYVQEGENHDNNGEDVVERRVWRTLGGQVGWWKHGGRGGCGTPRRGQQENLVVELEGMVSIGSCCGRRCWHGALAAAGGGVSMVMSSSCGGMWQRHAAGADSGPAWPRRWDG